MAFVPELTLPDAAGGEGISTSSSLKNDDIVFKDNHNKLELAGCPSDVLETLTSILDPIGFEFHPMMIGWYNEKVGSKFHLNYSPDTLAFVLISGPDIFEKCVAPYAQARILEDPNSRLEDPLDDSMNHLFDVLKEDLESGGYEVDKFHDFDLHASRRPKVLVQTAAHVAGAVQYLHKTHLSKDVQQARFSEKSNLCGVAIHPKYGGWFAIRGLIIISNLRLHEEKELVQKPEPVQIFKNEEDIARVIELFAYKWKTDEWREIHQGMGIKYSEDFLVYFDTELTKRWEYVKAYCLRCLT